MKNNIERSHTCPVVYLKNYASESDKYYEEIKNKGFRESTREDYEIWVYDKHQDRKFRTNLSNVAVRKKFYSQESEKLFQLFENKVAKEIEKIRGPHLSTELILIDLIPIFRFMVYQLIRTPKFQKKLLRDQEFLKSMDQETYEKSIMRLAFAKVSEDITKELINNIHEDLIFYNLLEDRYNHFTAVILRNKLYNPLLTSDSPVIYDNIEFFPTYLEELGKYTFSVMLNSQSFLYFPLSREFSVAFYNFSSDQQGGIGITDEITNFDLLNQLNSLIFRFSERFIYVKYYKDLEYVREIRKICGDNLNEEYPTLEKTHNIMEKLTEDKKKPNIRFHKGKL